MVSGWLVFQLTYNSSATSHPDHLTHFMMMLMRGRNIQAWNGPRGGSNTSHVQVADSACVSVISMIVFVVC
jgi:hypothetical protein